MNQTSITLRKHRHILFGLGLCLIVCIFMYGHALSKDPVNSAPLTIVKKGADYITASIERNFRVTDQTLILDLRKKKIKLTDLPVPCEAVIEYRLVMDQDPICQKIEVKSLKVDARDRSASAGE